MIPIGSGTGGGGVYIPPPRSAPKKAMSRKKESIAKKSYSRKKEPIAASRKRSSSSSSRRKSSSSSRRSSSSSSSRKYTAPKPKAAPKPPSIAAYLGTDSAYQAALRGGKRSLADFISELGRRRGEATTQFDQTKSSMERDRVQQLEDLRNEFASRGTLQSTLYADEQSRFNEQFTTQMNSLAQQQAALLADLLSQQKNYQREQDLAMEAARQEALQRRAAKYRIGA